MRPFAAVEQFLERVFERQTARLLHARLQPVQIQRRLERAMESARTHDIRRTVVPSRFTIDLNPDDLAALRASTPTLAADLADGALAFARGHGYVLLARPNVTLRPNARVVPGDVVIVAAPEPSIAPPIVVGDAAGAGDRSAGQATDTSGPDPNTAVFLVPGVDAPRATLTEIRVDGPGRSVVIDGRPLSIGRSPDNGLVLSDSRVSRYHARLTGKRGALILADLGSTNGSWVNDERVSEVVLGTGDRIRLGDTLLVVESVSEG